MALNGLVFGNLDAIWHSKMHHLTQYPTLEEHFFELILKMASLQPIA